MINWRKTCRRLWTFTFPPIWRSPHQMPHLTKSTTNGWQTSDWLPKFLITVKPKIVTTYKWLKLCLYSLEGIILIFVVFRMPCRLVLLPALLLIVKNVKIFRFSEICSKRRRERRKKQNFKPNVCLFFSASPLPAFCHWVGSNPVKIPCHINCSCSTRRIRSRSLWAKIKAV